MGWCGTSKSKSKSKLQDEEEEQEEEEEESPSPAVALCRERCGLLELSLRQRFTFAQAHAAYFLSLDSFALSLHRFSILNLPSPSPNSHSDDSDSHSDPSHSRLHHTYVNVPPDPDYRDGAYFFNTTYMKNHTTPSFLHTQPQKESMYVAQAQLFSASPPSSNNNNPLNPSPHSTATSNKQNQNPAASYSYPNHNFINTTTTTTTTNYGDAGPEGGVLGANSSLPAAPSSSSAVPPPPPPPRNLAWDFLNPFDTTVGSFYPAGHDSREKEEREARGAEGIPDLEDDVLVVKETHVDQRFLSGGSGIHSKPSVADHSALARERIKDGGNASAGTSFKGGEPQVVREIQLQFERASDSGSELAKFLEVGKLPYNGKSRTTQAVAVASKILHVPLPSLCIGTDPTVLDLDEDFELSSINLSSTLHKLRLWEKKMYKEVKFEEKMRVIHERKSRGLKHLDERGAENPKVDATRNLVRSLSTKIKISMQVVDKISAKINDLRDGELWPQLHELIHRLTRMWRSMAECHGNQWRAIREAKQYLDGIEFQKQQFDDVHCEATCQLERDLINWSLSFSCWVAAQKDYAHMLNNWLMKCLHYVPEAEETVDGIPPFSPGRIGAPPVFVICNEWSKSMNRISEKEVMESMREFASHVLLLWDQVKAEMSSLKKKKKDGGKFNKSLEKEDHKMRKEIDALDKRMILLTSTGSGVNGGEEGRGQRGTGTLQASLKHVLEAMEKFAASSLKIYQDLLKHIDELGGAANEKVSLS